ncbi:hypothetical protein JD969_17340 [Planctomycetota bacterium]|nr:hypothetical protein JD969_17340 [Planctomycetota bacterium]
MMKPDNTQHDNLDDLFANTEQPSPDQAFIDTLHLKLQVSLANKTTAQSVKHKRSYRLRISSYVAGFSAAAAVLAFTLILLLLPQSNSVTFASAHTLMRDSNTAYFEMHLTAEQLPIPEAFLKTQTWLDSSVGYRTDFTAANQPLFQTVSIIDESTKIIDHLHQQIYELPQRKELKSSLLKMNPGYIINKIRSDQSIIATPTEPVIIQGINAAGFTLTSTKFDLPEDATITAYIDPQTHLPLQITCIIPSEILGNLTLNITQIQWNLPIQSSIFELTSPKNYQPKDIANLKIPTQSEYINALRIFSQFTGGYYPFHPKANQKITSAITAAHEISNNPTDINTILKHANQIKASAHFFDRIAKQFIYTCEFYISLEMQNQNPKYFGLNTHANQPQAPLLQWQLDDNTQRVIYNDLTFADIHLQP